jgi:hypothetical protein
MQEPPTAGDRATITKDQSHRFGHFTGVHFPEGAACDSQRQLDALEM